jgi:hypothetical protein
MLTSVEGRYRNGKVELNEVPLVQGDADVLVTFLRPSQRSAETGNIMTSGMLAVPGVRRSEPDDFKVGEFDEGKWDRE